MFGPFLQGEKIKLRPPIEGDAAKFIEWFADIEVTRYLAQPFPGSMQQQEEFFRRISESRNDVWWAIEAEGRTIGGTAIENIDWINGRGVTGTVIGDTSCWHKGYGSEAMALRTEFAFRQLNLHKLRSGAFMENEPSKRALQKAGYRQVGVESEHFWRDGRWHDYWACEVLRTDWEKAHAE